MLAALYLGAMGCALNTLAAEPLVQRGGAGDFNGDGRSDVAVGGGRAKRGAAAGCWCCTAWARACRQNRTGISAAHHELVWATNPGQDTPAGLANYLAEFAPRFLEAHGVACELELPAQPQPRARDPERRARV